MGKWRLNSTWRHHLEISCYSAPSSHEADDESICAHDPIVACQSMQIQNGYGEPLDHSQDPHIVCLLFVSLSYVRACPCRASAGARRSEEHTSELQSLRHLVCRLLL